MDKLDTDPAPSQDAHEARRTLLARVLRAAVLLGMKQAARAAFSLTFSPVYDEDRRDVQ